MAVSASRNTHHKNHPPLLPSSGRELLLDLKRSTARNHQSLPAYNTKLVQACFRDLHVTAHELDLQAQLHSSNGSKPSMSARPSILLHNKTIQRQKQCLLAYHHHRMGIIREIQKSKLASNESTTKASISTNAQEVTFAKDYAALRNAYSQQVFELGLLPPTSHMVQVRVRKDVGQVVLPESGRVVSLQRGSCLFLDRADAKDFLRQGVVQLYDGEEVDF